MSAGAPDVRGTMAGERACRVCGCTDKRACADLFDDACHWIEPGLCSACIWEVAPYRGAFRAAPGPRPAFAGAGAMGAVRSAHAGADQRGAA